MTRTVAVVACRLESTRLYGKPMHLLGDEPILHHLLQALRQAKSIDEIVLAISDGPGQGVFVDQAAKEGLRHHIGSEQDVLQRTVDAGRMAEAGTVVRVTPDCPFAYWENVDEMVALKGREGAHLVATGGLPHGTAVEVIDWAALDQVCRSPVAEGRHHEHSTMFIVEHPERYKIIRLEAPESVRRPDIRLTVDLPEDLIVMRLVYDALRSNGLPLKVEDIVKLMDDKPEIRAINRQIETLHLWK